MIICISITTAPSPRNEQPWRLVVPTTRVEEGVEEDLAWLSEWTTMALPHGKPRALSQFEYALKKCNYVVAVFYEIFEVDTNHDRTCLKTWNDLLIS